MSIEGILKTILQELAVNAITTNQSTITEESPSASSPPIQKEEGCSITANLTTNTTTTSAIVHENCIVEEVEEKTECCSITITPSSRRPSAAIAVSQPPNIPEEPAVILAQTTQASRMILSLNNLETHLSKFSICFDSMLILHVLLHKLTWDLGLVSKRRNTQIGEPHRPATSSSDIRAHSSASLGSPFK
jgi:hypothetical protein